MKQIERCSPSWSIAAPCIDTITSLLISILHQNYHQCINLGHKKNTRDSPFWSVAAHWSDTITSSLLSILHQMIINKLTSSIYNERYSHFWDVAYPCGDTTTSSLFSVLHSYYHQFIHLSHGKMQGIPPFGPYLTLGLTHPHTNFYPHLTLIIINELTRVMKKCFKGLYH